MNPVSFSRTIATEPGLRGFTWMQTPSHDLSLKYSYKSPCALTALNNKINMHNRYDMRLVIFIVCLFSYVNLSWIQLALKIYYN